MAAAEDVGDYWLPSEFLDDDCYLGEERKMAGADSGTGGAFGVCCLPSVFSYDCDSNLSSFSAGSVARTESDEEEEQQRLHGVAGLGWPLSGHSPDHGSNKGSSAFVVENQKVDLGCSPQSTLYPAGSWSMLGGGSPTDNGHSSPSPQELLKEEDALDLLYTAAEQVVRVRIQQEIEQLHHHHHQQKQKQRMMGRLHRDCGLLGPPRKPSTATTTGYYANQTLTQRQLHAAQFQQLKHQLLLKQQPQQRGRKGPCGAARPLGGISSSSPWAPQQQRPPPVGSGMRAVFLSGARKESSGTGVFLPRRAGNPNESRKKAACSTVLLPARVVQALNLNLDEVGAHPVLPGGFVLNNCRIGGAQQPQHRTGMTATSNSRHLRPCPPPQQPSASPRNGPIESNT